MSASDTVDRPDAGAILPPSDLALFADMQQSSPGKRRQRFLRLLAAIPLLALAAWLGGEWAWRNQLAQLIDQRALELHTQSVRLHEVIDRYATAPGVAALHPTIEDVLRHPDDPVRVDRANRYLKELSQRLDTDVVYVLDARGMGVAASNWDSDTTFVGIDLSYRPYFKEALGRGQGQFWGIGTTTNRPGYFFAEAMPAGAPTGVVVVKLELARIAARWQPPANRTVAVDDLGVVLLSSTPEWQYRPLMPLPPDVLARFRSTRQYEGQRLDPIGVEPRGGPLAPGTMLVTLGTSKESRRAAPVLMQHASVGQFGWQIVSFSDLSGVRLVVLLARGLSMLAVAMAVLAVMLVIQRRRARRQERTARDALLRAKRELEDKVRERTHELVTANARLRDEVGQRARTADELRATQDELVHAGKLAVLGQMAAGITHELNQPLAALRALSENTQLLLERDMRDDARDTVARMSGLVERMAGITGQLRLFARKGTVSLEAAPVAPMIASARLLLDARLRARGITVGESGVAGASILCDPSRMEQVFVNLLSNAIDALADVEAPRIDIVVTRGGGRVRIAICDNGPGVPDDILPRVFDPFVTAKSAGAGLGLGLTISHKILRDIGGALHVRNLPDGGAEFTVDVPAATTQPEPTHA